MHHKELMVSLKVILCERIETSIVCKAYVFNLIMTQCVRIPRLLNVSKQPMYKCNMSSHSCDEMFSVLGTQRQLSKFATTINGNGKTFMGDGITANIGAPPTNGNYLLKKVRNFRIQRHFQPPTKNAIRLYTLLWSILTDIFRTDLFHLLSFVFISLSGSRLVLICPHKCFPVLIFCFYLYLNLCQAREFTYCHFRNILRLSLSEVSLP